ncbi:hypothetical protein KEM52_005222, partial [Ascosphaera acerosa]
SITLTRHPSPPPSLSAATTHRFGAPSAPQWASTSSKPRTSSCSTTPRPSPAPRSASPSWGPTKRSPSWPAASCRRSSAPAWPSTGRQCRPRRRRRCRLSTCGWGGTSCSTAASSMR